MQKTRSMRFALLLPALAMGCAPAYVAEPAGTTTTRQVVVSGPQQAQGQTLFTMTNLRPNARGVISSVAYTHVRGGVLPMCTPVRIDRIRGREIRFTSLNDNRRFRYILHRSARSGVQAHQQRYFGPSCPNMGQMSPEDQSGIQNAAVYQGMTKQGVIAAIGYPPEHVTPSLDGDIWGYWAGRMRRFEVHFMNGRVSGMSQ